jgi:hypothetical protein
MNNQKHNSQSDKVAIVIGTSFVRRVMAFFSWLWCVAAPTFVERMGLISPGKVPAQDKVFFSDASTIFCAIVLSKPTLRTKVRFEWKALSAEGLARGALLSAQEYRTRLPERVVRCFISAPSNWPTGVYRVVVYLNGAIARTMDYTIIERPASSQV